MGVLVTQESRVIVELVLQDIQVMAHQGIAVAQGIQVRVATVV